MVMWASVLVLAAVVWGMTGGERQHPFFSVLMVVALVVALGCAMAGLRTWWVAAPVLQKETGPISLSGQVQRLEVLSKGQRVTLKNLHIVRMSPDIMPKSVRIKLNGVQPSIQPGDWVEMRANVRPPPPPAMPGAFDFQRHSYFLGLGGVGFAYGKVKVIGQAPVKGIESLSFAFARLRSNIAERVRSGLAGPRGAVAVALMTGERGAIPEPVLDDMRASGLAHLLAISGLHVGLIAGIVFFALRAILALSGPLALRYPIKKWAAFGAILAAGGYALLAGATVPTQRAFLMIALMLLALLFDRKAISMRMVAWAALVILLIAPDSLLGASFQMSFSAVVALVAVYEVVQKRGWLSGRGETWGGRMGRYILGVALTSAIAGLSTGIFAAYHFNRVADFGLAANLIAVPVTALWIMPWAVVSYVLMPFGLESLALAPMGWGIEAVTRTAHEVASWPGAVSMVPVLPDWGLAIVALGGLWLALWQGRLRLFGIPILALGLTGFGAYSAPDVLVHQDGKLAAVRTPTGQYHFSTLKSAKFERDVWLRRAGLSAPDGRWRGDNKAQAYVRCDALGCLSQIQGKSIAFAHTPQAVEEDCGLVDIMIITSPSLPAVGCRGQNQWRNQGRGILITLQDIKSQGTHAIWLDDPIQIETVADRRGLRPWVIQSIP